MDIEIIQYDYTITEILGIFSNDGGDGSVNVTIKMDVNTRRRIFLSLTKLGCGLNEFNSRKFHIWHLKRVGIIAMTCHCFFHVLVAVAVIVAKAPYFRRTTLHPSLSFASYQESHMPPLHQQACPKLTSIFSLGQNLFRNI